jgi:hypothetical protein
MQSHTNQASLRRRRRTWAAGLAASAALAATAPLARADTVTDWNDTASAAIVGVAKQPPPVAVLSFAMTQGAVYDAVEAIDGRYRPYLVAPAARRSDSEDAAAATAAFRVLSGVLADLPPAQETTLQDLLQPRYIASLAAIADGPRKTRGISDGERAAAAMRAARHDDGNPHNGRSDPFTPVIGTTPGAWPPRRRRSPWTRPPGSPTSGRSWSRASTCCASRAPTR